MDKQVAEFLRKAMKRGVLRIADPKTAAVHLLTLLESELLQRVLLGVMDSVKPGTVRDVVRYSCRGTSAPKFAGPTRSQGLLPSSGRVAAFATLTRARRRVRSSGTCTPVIVLERQVPRNRLSSDLSIHPQETWMNRLGIVRAAERAYGYGRG